MKFITLALIFVFSSVIAAKVDKFHEEAPALVKALKESLVKELTQKMSKEGPVEAVPYCHMNVKHIAKTAAKDYLAKYEFGRTSHKVRNIENRPLPWMNEYLKQFEGTNVANAKQKSITHQLPDGKRVYLEPLYVQPLCLNCHGQNVSKNVDAKIKELYPQDKATGFKLGEFRGFVWVKEK